MNIPLRYSIEPRYRVYGLMGAMQVAMGDAEPVDWTWQCLECDSGSGLAPTKPEADTGARVHLLAFHTSQEVTADPAPQRRRPGWWHAIARLFAIPNTPRRAKK